MIAQGWAAEVPKVIPAQVTGEKSASAKEPVLVNGDSVEYFEDDHKAVANGNVVITYKDSTLTCDRATVWTETKDSEAEGHVQIKRGENVFSGERLLYNFETERGTILAARGIASPWYMAAPRAEKENRNKYVARNAWITTCDRFDPHYRIRASKVELYPEDKVIARNAVLYFFNIPVAYFPYYDHSLKEQQNKWSVTPGKNKEWGYFALIKYRYEISERLRGKIHFDWRERKGIAPGVDALYNVEPYGKGVFRFYWMEDKGRNKAKVYRNALGLPADRDVRNRYRFQVRHQWQIGLKTYANLEFHKTSDQTFIRDFFFREEFEKDPVPQSYLSLIHSEKNFTLSFLGKKRFNHFEDGVERMPEVSLDTRSIRLGKSDFYAESDSTVSNLTSKFAHSDLDDGVVRFDTTNKVTYRRKLFGWIEAAPFVGHRETAYSRDITDEKSPLRGQFQTGAQLSTRFYKVFDVHPNILGTQYHRLLHVIHPTIGYTYNSEPTTPSNRLIQMDGVDGLQVVNRFPISLENSLLTKWGKGDRPATAEIVRFVVSTNYLYRELKRGRWDKIKYDLEIRPADWIYIASDWTTDPKRLTATGLLPA